MFENCAITHKAFGAGTVVFADGSHICIRFSDENQTEKTFLYPEAFETFLTLDDETQQKQAMTDFAAKKAVQKKKQEERTEYFHQMDLARRKERAEKLKKARKTTAAKTSKAKSSPVSASRTSEEEENLAVAE